MARKIPPLTDTQIKKAKPTDSPLRDGNGLLLFITENSKLWRFRYDRPLTKKRNDLGLGSYPDVTLEQARAIRNEYRSLLANGIDPQEHRQTLADEEIAKRENTLRKVAEKWREKKAEEVQPQTIEKNWARLEKHLFPKLANVAVSEISPKLVIQVLEPLRASGKGDTLHRVIRLLNEILNFAVNAGVIEFNKCLKVAENFTTYQSKHNPTIRPEQLPEFLADLRDGNHAFNVKALIKWQLLTMTRPKEAVNAEWAEIDLERKQWTIPAEKMKGGRRSHTIPLSTQAVGLLQKMAKLTEGEKYVFQSETKRGQAMNPQTANATIKRLNGGKYEGVLTAHGLRSIASTYLNEQLINYDVIEACLSHVIADQTRKAYNRSDYLEQRVAVMQQWADFVEQCERESVGI